MKGNKNEVLTRERTIPIFFSTDDNYAPYLIVALTSIKINASREFSYRIHILTTGLSEGNTRAIMELEDSHYAIELVDVSEKLKPIMSRLFTRDYYSMATYYRFFIGEMFPQYDKALYLDCDIIVTGDISELYNADIGRNVLGAIPEEVMAKYEVFWNYVEAVLEIPCKTYFNAGVLVINLSEFRKRDIIGQFVRLIGKRRFDVTQDQDYLNVICCGATKLFDLSWNKTPIYDEKYDGMTPKLIHYKINWKPWHYDNIIFGESFWEYAKLTSQYELLLEIKKQYSDENKRRDNAAFKSLYQLAKAQTEQALRLIPERA